MDKGLDCVREAVWPDKAGKRSDAYAVGLSDLLELAAQRVLVQRGALHGEQAAGAEEGHAEAIPPEPPLAGEEQAEM